jgi:tetratricopeptide (TPR) repeat protein
MRISFLIYLFILGLIMTEKTAAVETDCESFYQEMMSNSKHSTPESKIQSLLQQEKKCSGTGLYESRLSYFYGMTGNYKMAKAILEKGLAFKNEYHQQLKYSLVDLLVQQGDMKAAYIDALKLRDEYPEWQASHMLLAKIALMEKKYAESVVHGIKANSLLPTASVCVGLVMAYHQLDKHHEAVLAMRGAISLDKSVKRSSSGMNEAIYSAVELGDTQAAIQLVAERQEADKQWEHDPVFVKAVRYLHDKELIEKE